jgi:hypothetical protein
LHKSVCRQSEGKKAKDQAALEENEKLLEESLLENGQLELGETISVPYDSYLLKNVRPVSELPRGWQKMMAFPPQFLASISHLPVGEQEKAKNEWTNDMEAMVETSMNPEARDA